mmetsp:Transcript_11105/g.12264  ORF Transcript_11105/g.12264 Transcript_11105/m.12264 type:complete len:278 (-) Transcript_11105:141-974(-)
MLGFLDRLWCYLLASITMIKRIMFRKTGPQTKRICIFGISADPPTGKTGHVGIVSSLAALGFDEILVLPVYKHMFTEKRNKQSNFDHRLEMCRIAFQGIPNVVVTDQERALFNTVASTKNDPTEVPRLGTIDLLEFLIKEYEVENIHPEFTLAMGADTFMDLLSKKWRRWNDIIQTVQGRFVVKIRGTTNDDSINEEKLKKSVLEKIDEYNEKHMDACSCLPASYSLNVQFLEGAVSNTSSSGLRENGSELFWKECLTKEVFEYISHNELYCFNNSE